MPHVRLTDRAVLTVRGEAAEAFLQTLVTSDLDGLAPGEARPSALLTPQGKILFDFLLSRIGDGIRLDGAASARDDLLKRLTLYRLRAKVAIEPSDEGVFAAWNGAPPEGASPSNATVDRRFPGGTVFRLYGDAPAGGEAADAAAYDALCVRAGVVEAERDFPASEVFPHDVLLDQNGGVSFRKGCYVGQEVVSRMQHRGTARRRLVLLRAQGHLTPGAAVIAAGRAIGTVLSAAGTEGVGLVRIDRLAEAMASGDAIAADGVAVEATIPSWAGYALPDAAAAAADADGAA